MPDKTLVSLKSKSLMHRRELIMGLAAGSIVPLVGGCAENAALGRSQLMLVSDGQLAQLSDQAWQDSLQRERVLRDPSYTRRLQRVGERVVAASGQTHLDWEFVVFDSDTVKARSAVPELPSVTVAFETDTEGVLTVFWAAVIRFCHLACAPESRAMMLLICSWRTATLVRV